MTSSFHPLQSAIKHVVIFEGDDVYRRTKDGWAIIGSPYDDSSMIFYCRSAACDYVSLSLRSYQDIYRSVKIVSFDDYMIYRIMTS